METMLPPCLSSTAAFPLPEKDVRSSSHCLERLACIPHVQLSTGANGFHSALPTVGFKLASLYLGSGMFPPPR